MLPPVRGYLEITCTTAYLDPLLWSRFDKLYGFCLLDSPDDTVCNCLLGSKLHTGIVTCACFQAYFS